MKINPDWLNSKMALLWTGKSHTTYELTDRKRDFDLIVKAGSAAKDACSERNIFLLGNAVNISYEMQLKEGMNPLPDFDQVGKKYCGGGFGGYALYLFDTPQKRDRFLEKQNTVKIEPYLK